MISHRRFGVIFQIALLLVSACNPVGNPPNEPGGTVIDEIAATTGTPDQQIIPASTLSAPKAILPSPTVPAIAISRGPGLEATNPVEVSLSSGGLQLVEFFRFT